MTKVITKIEADTNTHYFKKESLVLKFNKQQVHSYHEIELESVQNMQQYSSNQNYLEVSMKLYKLETSAKKLPRVAKEVRIHVGNGKVVLLKDIYTVLGEKAKQNDDIQNQCSSFSYLIPINGEEQKAANCQENKKFMLEQIGIQQQFQQQQQFFSSLNQLMNVLQNQMANIQGSTFNLQYKNQIPTITKTNRTNFDQIINPKYSNSLLFNNDKNNFQKEICIKEEEMNEFQENSKLFCSENSFKIMNPQISKL